MRGSPSDRPGREAPPPGPRRTPGRAPARPPATRPAVLTCRSPSPAATRTPPEPPRSVGWTPHRLFNPRARGVRAQPGQHVRAYAEGAGLVPTTAVHHLRQLERAGLVQSLRLQGKRVYLPKADAERTRHLLALAL